jgi:hypothetical protein
MTINKRTVKLPAGAGAEDPTKAVKIPVLPGKHRVQIDAGGGQKQEEVVVEAGATWGVIAVPGGGTFVDVLY